MRLLPGHVLRPDDAATLHAAWLISERRGIPIETGVEAAGAVANLGILVS
jgi:hypothetical protein